ncbi:hypothetical protein V6Z96_004230 [Aspergillus fumigatus]|nr:hypothetical protein KXV48_004855 [Aspergillus fumigatus]KMK62078.1 hypothetical protein Y699_02919 [Aspergillus fumigatus Z5]KAH2021818.1 hypothetical protein KXV45_001875 [Aspergillus fumigatus]KAH2258030.1 hypothetical protein KXW14_000194 [Aspergillus fumigatus]KAH2336454.1 hypothetical protein KXW87_007063 [Aspergillus fumigatus]
MDAQYPFASRDDIWRVFEELKELHAAQFEQAERIARLERRRDEDARLRSVWGPLSPFPTSIGGTIPTDPVFPAPADAFKGFDQGQHHGMANPMGLDSEDEPRRGTSRANSVRFDESAIHGYYGQASRSTSELPLRTGSGMGSHPLTERSLSHRSDGRQSSSGHSHHSARTNSLGLETTSRLMGSFVGGSPLIPPPGLFLLGPVPCVIRCWLTTNFSNDSLLYAAVCSGSYASILGYPMVQKLGLEDLVTHEDGVRFIKLPMYLPEASVHQASSRPNSPVPQLPTLTIRFLVRDMDPNDPSIQIILGSDVLRSHNADILFSQDKIIMVDDERNKISIPLVRPEDDSVFKSLCTASDCTRVERSTRHALEKGPTEVSGDSAVGAIGELSRSRRSTSASTTARASTEELDESRKTHSSGSHDVSPVAEGQEDSGKSTSAIDFQAHETAKPETAGVWGAWRREMKIDPASSGASKPSRGRTMKVLRPTKSSTRVPTASSGLGTDAAASPQPTSSRASSDESRAGKQLAPNPIGGASAFGWLNSSQPPKRVVTMPK